MLIKYFVTGIGNGNLPINECINMARRKFVVQHWKTCKHLIIDEISMVDGEYFEVCNGLFIFILKLLSTYLKNVNINVICRYTPPRKVLNMSGASRHFCE